jgi:hypothetical protein
LVIEKIQLMIELLSHNYIISEINIFNNTITQHFFEWCLLLQVHQTINAEMSKDDCINTYNKVQI